MSVDLDFKARTIHNGAASVSLVSKTDNHGELHFESNNPVTINADDWNDGDWFRTLNTSGTDLNVPFNVNGFAGAFLRDGTSMPIVVATNLLGKQDARHTVTITENPLGSGIKYLNVDIKQPLTTNVQAGVAYTAVAADSGKIIRLTNASPVTLGISALLDNTITTIIQSGAGQVTIVGGSHVALLNKTAGQRAAVRVTTSGGVKYLSGDLS